MLIIKTKVGSIQETLLMKEIQKLNLMILQVNEEIPASNKDVYMVFVSGATIHGGKYKENFKLIDNETKKTLSNGSAFMLLQYIMKHKLNLIETPANL